MRNCLGKDKSLHRQFACPPPIRSGCLKQPCCRVMVSEQFRDSVPAFGSPFERLRDPGVKGHSLTLEQGIVGGILYKSVLERIYRLRNLPTTGSQLGGNQTR